MRRLFSGLLVILASFFFLRPLFAQSPSKQEPKTEFFPLALVLDAAEEAVNGILWQPDWPLDLPPDAFKVKDAYRLSMESEGISLVFFRNTVYQIQDDGSALASLRVEEFPFVIKNKIAQVKLSYRGLFEISGIVINFQSGEESWKLEVLESDNSYPSLVRSSLGESWFFIALSRGLNEINESWYDEEGTLLGAYRISLAAIGERRRPALIHDFSLPGEDCELYYDSRCLMTEKSGPEGIYKVQYYKLDLPRYLERGYTGGETQRYSFQWDERDLLVRLAGDDLDSRYEYTLDERGNWTERRECCMVPGLGLVYPAPGTVFKRGLEYFE